MKIIEKIKSFFIRKRIIEIDDLSIASQKHFEEKEKQVFFEPITLKEKFDSSNTLEEFLNKLDNE